MDTNGFYKLDDVNNKLMYGANLVDGNRADGSSFNLHRDSKDEHTYPIEGWYWFDTREEALAFFNMTE